MTRITEKRSGSMSGTQLSDQLHQVSEICGQFGLCWCLQYPAGERIAKQVRSALA